MKPRIMYLTLAKTDAPDYVRTGFWINENGQLRGWNEYVRPDGTRGPQDFTAEEERDGRGGWKVCHNDALLWPGLVVIERHLRDNPFEGAKP